MIKMFTAFTKEADNPAQAAGDIARALSGAELSRNAVGIVHCHSDFAVSGSLKAVCAALPFPIVGCTTTAATVNGFSGRRALTLAALSGEGIEFASAVSPAARVCAKTTVAEMYGALNMPSPPVMFMVFIPAIFEIGGDEFLDALDGLSGGVPAFGSIPASNNPQDGDRGFTIYGGELLPRSMVAVALRGRVNPEFFTARADYRDALKREAVVTGAESNILRSVNGMPAVKFFESIGLIRDGDASALTSIPMIFRAAGRPPLIRDCAGCTPDGGLAMLGAVPDESRMSLVVQDPTDIVNSSAEAINAAKAKAGERAVLMYSCAWRSWMLGKDALAEHHNARRILGDSPSFMLAQSGGEIIPAAEDAAGVTMNSFQNSAFTICVL